MRKTQSLFDYVIQLRYGNSWLNAALLKRLIAVYGYTHDGLVDVVFRATLIYCVVCIQTRKIEVDLSILQVGNTTKMCHSRSIDT